MIQRGPYPSLEIPDQSLSEFILRRARALGDRPAFVDAVSGATTTYAGVLEAVHRASSALIRRGLQPGDVVATFTPNSIDCPATFHAIVRAGAIVAPLNPLLTAEEARRLLLECGARFLVTTTGCVPVPMEVGT